jgi:fructoselysine and glucoselysine-specific PTS system IIA component
MEKYATFILTHEQMAICLQRASEKILGTQKNLFPYTNMEDSLPVLEQKILKDIKKVNPDRIVCFVDLAGGSCWALANKIQKQDQRVHIISGVNMPMLVSYFSNLNEMSFAALLKKIITDANRGILHVEGDL